MTRLHWNTTRLAFVSTAAVLALACSDSPVGTTKTVGPLSLTVVSGDGQSALANTELPAPLVVRVEDDKGHRVRDQIVNFRVISGGGSVYAGTSLTNSDGEAREWWTLGASGAQSVEVRAVNPTTGEKQVFATFTATITPPPPPPISPDAYEPNNTQGSRTIADLGNGDSHTLLANFHTTTDVDWYRYDILDGTNPGCSNPFDLSEHFSVRATLTVPVGSIYRMIIFVGGTVAGTRDVQGGLSDFVTASYSGTCGSDDHKTVDVQVQRMSGEPTATSYSLSVSVTEQ